MEAEDDDELVLRAIKDVNGSCLKETSQISNILVIVITTFCSGSEAVAHL